MGVPRYNTRVQRRVLRGLFALAALAAVLLPMSAEGGTFDGQNGPIAYTCATGVCVVNPDGTSVRTLVAGASDPNWSSTQPFAGPYIVYSTASAGVMDVAFDDGTGAYALPGNGSQPTFSFSGDDIAYVSAGDIFTQSADTTACCTNLTNTPGVTESDPAYSPDGTQLAFVAGGQIKIYSFQFSTTRAVTTTAVSAHDPSWSPDGSKIAYGDSGQVYTISATSTSGAGTPLVAGSQPTYAPDGTKIAFVNGSGQLSTIGTSGGAATSLGVAASQPDWEQIDSSAGPPRNTTYPAITLARGDTQPVVGHLITANVGAWDGSFPITYTFQWKRCDAADPANGACFDIPGATSSFYTPTNDDLGKRLRVQVTATNNEGSASQNSEVTAIVIAIAPKVQTTPAISDDSPVVDTPLTLSDGVWDGSTPIAFTYSWRRCNPVGDLASCVAIPDATDSTYTPAVADIGFSLRVWITGTNPQGTDTAITNHTFPVVDKPHFAPSAAVSPLVGGTPGIARQLTANIGEYDGDAPIKTAFTWQRCDATGADCHVIVRAKKVVYFPTAADVGYTLRIVVKATNAYGDVTMQSDPTEPIAQLPPHVKGRHIVGTAHSDYLAGGGHDDFIEGAGGNDTLVGGAGDDRIDGGPGNDIITGGAGADHLNGGPGSDTIYAADGERDIIDCGPGRDRVVADDVDKTVNCEVVVPPPTPVAATSGFRR